MTPTAEELRRRNRAAVLKRSRYRHDKYGPLWLDVTPYRDKVRTWREQGWSFPAIAQATGYSRDTIERVAGVYNEKSNEHVFRGTAWAIDHPDWTRVTGQTKIPAVGATRRLQGLARLGWSLKALSEELGVPRGTLSVIIQGRHAQIMADTHHAIAARYDRLAAHPPTGPNTAWSRNAAVRHGWAAPLAWDDNIDDPDAQPDTGRARRTSAAQLVLELADLGYNLDQIADRVGTPVRTLYIIFRRHGRLDVWERLQARDGRRERMLADVERRPAA